MDSEAYDNDNVTLDLESYQCKEIYAFFGLTMYHIQCLERTLSMLCATVYNPDANCITRSQFDSILEANFSKTLGQLITKIKKSVDLPDDFENKLADALKKRNFLVHNYFWERSLKFGHTQGQKEMMEELSQYSVFFEDMDHELDIVLRKWRISKGITDDVINQHLGKLLFAEIEKVEDEESVKQLMDIFLHEMLNDLTSKKV